MMKKIILSLTFILALIINISAQPMNSASGLEQTMVSGGKIYVAIAVLSVILVGIFFYLFSIDAKLRKLEDKAKQD